MKYYPESNRTDKKIEITEKKSVEIEVWFTSMGVSKREDRGNGGHFKKENHWEFFWLDYRKLTITSSEANNSWAGKYPHLCMS